MSPFVHIDENKDILILGEGPAYGLDDTTLIAAGKYSQLYIIMEESFLFVNATKIYQFKAKESEIKPYILCLV